MINYNTKFKKGERVQIVYGYFRDTQGVVTEYMPAKPSGLWQDNVDRKSGDGAGVYTINGGFFKSGIMVEESNLRSIEPETVE